MKSSKRVKDRVVDALLTAFSFVAAFSWRETLIKILDRYLPEGYGDLWPDIIATLMATLIAVIFLYIIIKADETIEEHLMPEDDTK